MHGRVVGAVAATALLAAPAAAGAATKTVQAGPFGAQAKEFQDVLGDGNAFYRRTITIRKGDSVRWKINGFHTVTFAAAGDPPPALAVPDLANPVTGVNDAAGAAFWFNSQPNLALNPLVAAPQGGGTFDPDELRNSGLPLGDGPPAPYKLKFKRKGTFRYLCVLHPGMEGTVKVRKKSQAVPSARKDKRAAKRELARTLRSVKRLSTGRGTEGLSKTIQAGNDRSSGATVFKFFPAAPAFKVGDTVTLQMPPASPEAHTFTFGPTNGENLYVDQLAAVLLGPVLDPRGVYPSEPPPAVPAFTGANHGNGFYNSGFLDQDPASPQPASTQITFTAAGTFPMICLIHPFMTAQVTVTQ